MYQFKYFYDAYKEMKRITDFIIYTLPYYYTILQIFCYVKSIIIYMY